MSIVGTRPPLISETNLYEPRHKARLAIKPGITGMLQILPNAIVCVSNWIYCKRYVKVTGKIALYGYSIYI